MTKNKAIEILGKEYDFFLNYREYPYVDIDEVNDRLIAILTAIDALEQVKGWISVKDRMPDDKKRYLICTESGRIDIAYYQPMGDKFSNHESFWQGSSCRFTAVTHWMPLPEPPKEESDT